MQVIVLSKRLNKDKSSLEGNFLTDRRITLNERTDWYRQESRAVVNTTTENPHAKGPRNVLLLKEIQDKRYEKVFDSITTERKKLERGLLYQEVQKYNFFKIKSCKIKDQGGDPLKRD